MQTIKNLRCKWFHKRTILEDFNYFKVEECPKCKMRYYYFRYSILGMNWKLAQLWEKSKYFDKYWQLVIEKRREELKKKSIRILKRKGYIDDKTLNKDITYKELVEIEKILLINNAREIINEKNRRK